MGEERSTRKLVNIAPFLTFTPGNIITWILLLIGIGVSVVRFTRGLGAVTNLTDYQPWGLWIGFDLLCGICFASSGYFAAVACNVMRIGHLRTMLRSAVTMALLGYGFEVFDLLYELGHPLRLPYMFFFPGTTSLLFEVGLCVATYLMVLLCEFSIMPMEWLSTRFPVLVRWREHLVRIVILLSIFAVTLSTMHQSSLGELYLIAPQKLHPLWYSQFLGLFFFVSSMSAGAAMIIFVDFLTRAGLRDYMDDEHYVQSDGVVLSLSRASSFILLSYFVMRVIDLITQANVHLLATGYGIWWLVEMLVFVLLPALLFARGAATDNPRLCRWTAVLAVAGVVVGRVTVALVAFNWQLPWELRYFPSLGEFAISAFVVTLIITTYRFIVYNMPVLRSHPDFGLEE